MCGICGALNFKTARPHTRAVEAILDKLQHRGPDFQTIKNYGAVTFGHARLKIIDTSEASNQPFDDHSGKLALVYNGECYNFRALRTADEKTNSTIYRTSGDTEVLFRLLQKEGSQCLPKINGMFAFAFWDKNRQQLLLARDRLGIKPLYYILRDDMFYFASEFRALLPVTQFSRINKDALTGYLTFQANLGEKTLHPQIKKLAPGTILKIGTDGHHNIETYYQLSTELKPNRDFTTRKKDIKKSFFESVNKRLISDVPIGAFLSGGIDSTAVVAAMHELGASPLKTFTLGFEDQNLDERQYARMVSQKFSTDHQEVVLSGREILDHVKQGVLSLDQPSGDAINTYLVSKFTKQAGLTVALSGLGGDELFGGYPSAGMVEKINKIKWFFKLPVRLRSKLADLFFRFSDTRTRKIRTLLSGRGTTDEIVKTLRTVFDEQQCSALIQASISHKKASYVHDFPNAGIYYELIYYTIPLLLKDTDQTSMANSLEVRVPFLDHQFISCVAKYPHKLLSRSGISYPKAALIDALEPLIPVEIYDRPKRGFVLPMDKWMKNELKEFTESGLFDSPLTSILDKNTLEIYWNKFLDVHEKGITWSRTWTLSVLGHWMFNTGLKE